jgi:hypothetical protein
VDTKQPPPLAETPNHYGAFPLGGCLLGNLECAIATFEKDSYPSG